MKLMHLSDLHLGKRVNEFSMMDDQKYILGQIVEIAAREKTEVVLISGDVYDKSVAPAEAVGLLNDFLVGLVGLGCKVLLISGNHDSPERLAFGRELMELSGVYLSPVYAGEVRPIVLRDEHGPVNFYLLPFVKPVHVRGCFPEKEIASYTDAVSTAVEQMGIDRAQRNVLLTHQFVTGASRCESEEVSVGGADNVDASAFDGFDYVALGHIHGPQDVAGPTVRYCGTPLKYSLSEALHKKSVTVVELGQKGEVAVGEILLKPKRDMVELRGAYRELIARSYYSGTGWQEDYVFITLTDEEEIPDAMARLRTVYHNLMKLRYDNTRTKNQGEVGIIDSMEQKSELELFADFYHAQNNQKLSDVQETYLRDLIESLKEDRA